MAAQLLAKIDNAAGIVIICLGFVAAIVVWRTVVVAIYLPFHLAMNRRGVPYEQREARLVWIGPASGRLMAVAD